MKSLLFWVALQPFNFDFNPYHVCGVNDFQYTTRYDEVFNVDFDWVQENAKPVVRVGGCSATLIDERVILTAAHCGIEKGYRARFNYVFDGKSKDTLVDKLMESDRRLDFAVMRLQVQPEGVKIRELTDRVPDLGEEVYLLGHPERKRMMISAGEVRYSDEFRIGYEADSLGGSSGSGVIDEDGKQFAVHQFGSCYADGRGYGYNGGTLIKKIAEKSQTVRKLLGYQMPEQQEPAEP